MQGISTKLTAAALAGAALTIINFVVFDATWGPGFPEFPEAVDSAVLLLVTFFSGYLVREQAVAEPTIEPNQFRSAWQPLQNDTTDPV